MVADCFTLCAMYHLSKASELYLISSHAPGKTKQTSGLDMSDSTLVNDTNEACIGLLKKKKKL